MNVYWAIDLTFGGTSAFKIIEHTSSSAAYIRLSAKPAGHRDAERRARRLRLPGFRRRAVREAIAPRQDGRRRATGDPGQDMGADPRGGEAPLARPRGLDCRGPGERGAPASPQAQDEGRAATYGVTGAMTAPPLSNRLADLAERAGRCVAARARAHRRGGGCLSRVRGVAGRGQGGMRAWRMAALPGARRDTARTATRMMRLAESGMSAETIAARRVRAAAEALARTPKPATVADLPAPPLTPTARARKRRAARRVAGRCVDCGAPAPAKARCPGLPRSSGGSGSAAAGAGPHT